MYNDLSWQAGQLGSNITVYTTGQSGFLRDYATGAATAVRLAISGGTVSDATRAQGSNASSGTDGYNVFNGIVDSVGLISYSAANLSFSFTGLDPTLRYEFVLFGNRNVAAYTDRLTRVAISDVVEFTNSSTAGAAFSGPADPAATIVNGYNTANGYVARFTDVNPGTDGDMLITVSSGDGHFYANALMLRAVEPFANQPPTALNDSAATDANRAVVIDVVANDTDPDGAIDPATVVVTVPPGHGTALANANGTVTYTPAAGYSGTDSFWYTVEDDYGDTSNQAIVGVSVGPSGPPIADAGPDQVVKPGVTVALDGSGSIGTINDVLSYNWVQTSGPAVVLSDPTSVKPTFSSPSGVTSDIALTFSLTVSNSGGHTSTDFCAVVVSPEGGLPGPDGGGSGSGGGGGGGCFITAAGD
jgi:hypothetical protein